MPLDLASLDFDAVLFDMDGTLLDSSAAVVRSWTRWAREFEVPAVALTGESMHGLPALAIVTRVLGADRQHLVAQAYRRIVELEVTDTDGCVPLPGALAALAAAGDRGAIVTSCSTRLAWARIRAAGLPAPAVVITADDVSRGKPDPEPFVTAAGALGADPARALVVEDAPAGLAAAGAAGTARLAVTTTHPADQLDADLVVASLADIRLVRAGATVRVSLAG